MKFVVVLAHYVVSSWSSYQNTKNQTHRAILVAHRLFDCHYDALF